MFCNVLITTHNICNNYFTDTTDDEVEDDHNHKVQVVGEVAPAEGDHDTADNAVEDEHDRKVRIVGHDTTDNDVGEDYNHGLRIVGEVAPNDGDDEPDEGESALAPLVVECNDTAEPVLETDFTVRVHHLRRSQGGRFWF